MIQSAPSKQLYSLTSLDWDGSVIVNSTLNYTQAVSLTALNTSAVFEALVSADSYFKCVWTWATWFFKVNEQAREIKI